MNNKVILLFVLSLCSFNSLATIITIDDSDSSTQWLWDDVNSKLIGINNIFANNAMYDVSFSEQSVQDVFYSAGEWNFDATTFAQAQNFADSLLAAIFDMPSIFEVVSNSNFIYGISSTFVGYLHTPYSTDNGSNIATRAVAIYSNDRYIDNATANSIVTGYEATLYSGVPTSTLVDWTLSNQSSDTKSIPEPSSLVILVTGLLGLGFRKFLKK